MIISLKSITLICAFVTAVFLSIALGNLIYIMDVLRNQVSVLINRLTLRLYPVKRSNDYSEKYDKLNIYILVLFLFLSIPVLIAVICIAPPFQASVLSIIIFSLALYAQFQLINIIYRMYKINKSKIKPLIIFSCIFTISFDIALLESYVRMYQSLAFLLILLMLCLLFFYLRLKSRLIKKYNKKAAFFAIELIIAIIVFTTLMFFALVYTTLGSSFMNTAVNDNNVNGNFDYLFNSTFYGLSDNATKVKAILQWQHENMFNAFITYDYYNIHVFPHSIGVMPNILLLLKEPPNNICLRLLNQTDPEWTLISKSGNCEELATAFSVFAEHGNVSSREIRLIGADHIFNEAFINGSWITIDPSISTIGDDYLSGYNVPPRTYVDGWGYNIVEAYAKYPNGTLEDVTYRYTNTSNITVLITGLDNSTINNATIQVSGNPVIFYSNKNGTCNLHLTSGKFTLDANNGTYKGEQVITVKQGEDQTIPLILNQELPTKNNNTLINNVYSDIALNFISTILIFIIVLLISLTVFFLITLCTLQFELSKLLESSLIPFVIYYEEALKKTVFRR